MKKFSIRKMMENVTYESQLNLIVQMMQDEQKKNIKLDKYLYRIRDNDYVIFDNKNAKVVVGPDYNYIFLKKDLFGRRTGFFQRWGKTPSDNPLYSPIGPEILDIEICINGCPNACSFCYKNNQNIPATIMPLKIFKKIINKIPKTLTQVAFGITGIQTNPDFLSMMRYCRKIGIIPNFTLTGIDLTDDMAKKVSKIAGAIAVSVYQTDKNVGYNTIKKFTDLKMNQVNMHLMVSQETLPFVYEILGDRLTDPRLSKLHASVFLAVKPKGRAKDNFHSLTKEQYLELVKFSLDKGLNFGFDSCGAPKFESAIKTLNMDPIVREKMIEASESCESSLFSAYINVYGEYWHCSFTEEEEGQQFVDAIQINDFIAEVWYSKPVATFRHQSINSMRDGCRQCTVFPEINIGE
jgi:hypothetical protein